MESHYDDYLKQANSVNYIGKIPEYLIYKIYKE
jgi:hypothetical protein